MANPVAAQTYVSYVTFINVTPQRDPDADLYRFMNDPRLREPGSVVAHGTRDPDEIRASAGQRVEALNVSGSQGASTPSDDDVGAASMQAVKDNLSAVVNGTLQDAAAYIEGSGRADAVTRLEQLRLVSVVSGSVKDEGSGLFSAQAFFREGDAPKLVHAKIIADFSDPHWHLTSIWLAKPAAPTAAASAAPASKPAAQEAKVNPVLGFRTAVYDYVRKTQVPGEGFPIIDSTHARQWGTMLRLIHTEGLESEPDGTYKASVEFVDSSQYHVFFVDFLVKPERGRWKVEKTVLRSVDGKSV